MEQPQPLKKFRERLEELAEAGEWVHVHAYSSECTGRIIVHFDYIEVVPEKGQPVLVPIDKITYVVYGIGRVDANGTQEDSK